MTHKLSTIFALLILSWSIKTNAAIEVGDRFFDNYIQYEINIFGYNSEIGLSVVGLDNDYYKGDRLDTIKIPEKVQLSEDQSYYVQEIKEGVLSNESIKVVILHSEWKSELPIAIIDITEENINPNAQIYVPYLYKPWYMCYKYNNFNIYTYYDDPQIEKQTVDGFIYCRKQGENGWELCGYEGDCPNELKINNSFTDEYGNTCYVTSINGAAFSSCNKLEKITIEEGITHIYNESFSGCNNLKYVSIPSTIQLVASTAFKASYTKGKTEIYIHVKEVLDGSYIGSDAFGYNTTLYVNSELIDKYKENGMWKELIDEYKITLKPIFTVDEQKIVFNESIEKINSNLKIYQRSIINMESDVELTDGTVNWDDGDKIININLGTHEYPFEGEIKGNGKTIKNFVAQSTEQSASILGNLGDSAKISDLIISGKYLVSTMSSGNKTAEPTDTLFIPLFADNNKGQVKGLSFVGQIYVDEELSNKYDEIALSWVGNNEEGASFSNSFVYLTEDLEGETKSATIGDNKVCVVLKQNMRIGKGKGRTYKVCSGPKGNKSAVNPDKLDDAEILSDTRECTAEQFANGEVAYWLNYDGKGYSNDYNKIWSQGNEYPVLATEKNKYLVKLLYVVNNDKYADSFAAPYFANVGTEATISFTAQPESITVDGVEIASTGNKARTRADVDHIGAFNFKVGYNKSVEMGASEQTFTVPETAEGKGIVTVKINFPAETAIAPQQTSDNAEIAVVDNRIIISNASGQTIKLYDLAGHCLATEQAPSDKVTIIVPGNGIYIAQAGDKTEKIVIR